MVPTPTCRFDSFTRKELADLAERLLGQDPIAIEWCVTFVEAETHGLGHGRARARMARRLKHCRLSKQQQDRLVRTITNRLVNGTFSEQFKDQLRLAIHLDPTQACSTAKDCQSAAAEHVRRYAAWILSRDRVRVMERAP
jgi:hypothetical protein